MNREIKFRGQKVSNNEFIIGNLVVPDKLLSGVYIAPEITYADLYPGFEQGEDLNEYKKWGCAIGHFYEVKPETIGQFTGLHDKNGKEVFEGDILKSESWGKNSKCKNPYHVVEYIGHRFVASGYNGDMKVSPDLDVKRDFEIIGNIFSNPELIK